jgi:hypothetical protein
MYTIRSIYHTARCGSTLLTSLLSSVAPSFAEPNWCRDFWENGDPIPEARDGAIVKFPSLTIFHHISSGPKVFLYRPLSQHLLKYRALDKDWLTNRAFTIKQYVGEDEYNGSTQFFAAAWVKQVNLALSMDAYFIRSNDLFLDPQTTASKVIGYFGLSGEPDLRFTKIDVKSARINGQGDPITYPNRSSIIEVHNNYGIVETEKSMSYPLIASAVEWVESNFPELRDFTR